MVENSLVSIIIPSFNSKGRITETLDSVIKQTYSHWEILFIDDFSIDGSYEEVLRYKAEHDLGDRMQVYRMSQNSGGPATPRNEGIKRARGEYIAFLDADDIWHPQKLELQMYYVHQNHVDFIASEICTFRFYQEIMNELKEGINESELRATKISHARLLYKNVIPTSSVLIRRSLITSHTFNTDGGYVAIEDYDMWLRILQKELYCYKLQNVLIFYRLSSKSISHSKFKMFKKIYKLYSTYAISDRSLGIKKYFYLCSYIILSVSSRLLRQRVRKE